MPYAGRVTSTSSADGERGVALMVRRARRDVVIRPACGRGGAAGVRSSRSPEPATDPARPRMTGRPTTEAALIFITARFPIKPEHADEWPSLSREFTEATRAEPGCLWFDWSRSLDDPNEYVLVEAFRDQDAGVAHVRSDHFTKATSELPAYLAATPRIVNTTVDGTEWSELGEMAVDK